MTATTETAPSGLDAVTGVALLSSLKVYTADQWAVCVCTDDLHRRGDLVTDAVWSEEDGRHMDVVPWRDDRPAAVRDLSLTPLGHVVVRRARIVSAPVEADL